MAAFGARRHLRADLRASQSSLDLPFQVCGKVRSGCRRWPLQTVPTMPGSLESFSPGEGPRPELSPQKRLPIAYLFSFSTWISNLFGDTKSSAENLPNSCVSSYR